MYTLPGNEAFANGIAINGDTYYVTDFNSGTIYRGDLNQPEAHIFISDTGFGAGGIRVVGSRLLVARGFAGVSLYDRTTGAVIATWSVAEGSWALRITIAPNGDAYITDADTPKLYRIPASQLHDPSAAEQELPVFLQWPDPPVHYERGFINANGIAATPDGKYVMVVHETTGELFRVRLSDKQVTRVDLGGHRLISGRGIVLTEGRVLYVVRPARPVVAKLRLDIHYRRARLLSETTDRTFHDPTAVAIAADRLLVTSDQTVSSISLP